MPKPKMTRTEKLINQARLVVELRGGPYDLVEKVIIIKGGPGSGNWGHTSSKRKGSRGGSDPGGGLRRLGLGADSSPDERRKLAGEFKKAARGADFEKFLLKRQARLEQLSPLRQALKQAGVSNEDALMYSDVMTLNKESFDRYGKRLGLKNFEKVKADTFNKMGGNTLDRETAKLRWDLRERNTHRPGKNLFKAFDKVDEGALVGKDAQEATKLLKSRYNVTVRADGPVDSKRVHREVSRILTAADMRPAVANTLTDQVDTIRYRDRKKHPSHTAVADYEAGTQKIINIWTTNHDLLSTQTLVHEIGHGAEEYAPSFKQLNDIFDSGQRVSMYAWGNGSESFADTFAYTMSGEDNRRLKSDKTDFMEKHIPGYSL